ncbi:tetratricopeptide repeat protein [Legionella steigerwaltii]|nr:tetratricopeptide repeat protein [Legionella steigerwaltii]
MHGAFKKKLFFFVLFLVSSAVFADNAKAIAYKYYLKGVNYEQSLYAFEARTAFQKALALDPKNPGYLTHYAWFLHLFGFMEQATVAFQKALNHPQGTNMYQGLAWDEFYLGNLAESQRDFKHFYTSRWLNSNYTNAFIKAPLMANRENELKIYELKQKLARDPYNLALQKDLFNNYIYHNEYDHAIALGRILIANKKTDNFTRLEFARTLFKNKQYDLAAAQYEQLMQRFPHNAFLAYEWGSKLVELRQYDAAYKMLAQSLEYYPSPEAKEALAKLAAQKGMCDTALHLLLEVSDKRSTGYLLGMGDAYRKCGEYRQANAYYQKVLQKYPYNSDALWGILSSTAAAHEYEGNRVAYDRWQEVYNWERSFLQEQLVDYYQSPMIPISADFYDSSNTFRRQDAGVAADFYAIANTRLNLSEAYSGFEQNGFDSISRNMVQLQGSKLFTEHWQLFAGISDKVYSNGFNNINGNVAVQYSWSETLNATLGFNHSDIIDTEPPFSIQIYNYIVAIGAVGLNIRTDDYSGSMYYQPTQNLSLWGKGVYGKYSDGNNKTQVSFEANYKLINIPQIRIIYDFFYLNYSNPAPIFTQDHHSQSAYYDPLDFQVHTGKVRIEHYVTSKLRLGIEDGLSFFPQNSSYGNAVAGYMDYKIVTHWGMRLGAQYYNQNNSIFRTNRNGGPFWAKAASLSFIYKV